MESTDTEKIMNKKILTDNEIKRMNTPNKFTKRLRQFNKKLAAQQRDIDPEIAKVVRENFWEML